LDLPIEIWIGQAEGNWLSALYSHAKKLYENTFLPSHDHTHHLRVWNISKQLMKEIASSGSFLTPELVEGVLIASFFHDLGMVESIREDHGRLGRLLCQSWFSESGQVPPAGFAGILEAIEMHDRKQARIYQDPEMVSSPGILAILSVADDLEAMGVIGIYRYAEIYLLRDIPLKDLGHRILVNAEHRFSRLHASGTASWIPGGYSQQYDELIHFYHLFNSQLQTADQAGEVLEGPVGVINYIRNPGLTRKIRPEDLCSLALEEGAEPAVSDFFNKLKHELEKERL